MKRKILGLMIALILMFSGSALAASTAYQKETCKGNVCVLQVLWTSSAEAMPNLVDRDFSGASAWTNVDIGTYNETDDLTITAAADGVLANRDTAVTEFTRFLDNTVYGGVYNIGPLFVDITNEGRSKSGVINIWFRKFD